MNRLALAGATALVIGSLFGGAMIAHAQGSEGSGDSNQAPGEREHGRRGPGPFRGPGPGGRPGPFGGPGPGGRPGPGFLPGIPGGHSFDQLLGSETRYKDNDGNVHTVITYPGIVTKIDGNKLTIKLNDGAAEKTFDVPESLDGVLDRLNVDDKVIMTVDGEVKAILRAPTPRPALTDEQREKLKAEAEKRREGLKAQVEERLKKLREERQKTPTPTPSTSNTTNA